MRVKFWPKETNILAEKCIHRFGADATFTEQTDTRALTSIYACELFGFKHNFRLGAFIWNLAGAYVDGISETEETGVIRHDTYFATDYWKNPNTGIIEQIPDYYATSWTSLGVSYFSNAVLGQPKSARTPNHGQQLYNISNGVYGYDYTTEELGTNNGQELYPVINQQKNWLKTILGREQSAASFRNGQAESYLQLIPYFLGIRNSGDFGYPGNANSWYGNGLGNPNALLQGDLDRTRIGNYHSSSRSWDRWQVDPTVNKPLVMSWIESQIKFTCQNNGWWRDFIHWHSMRANNTLASFEELLQSVKDGSDGYYLHSCSIGEALEYLFLREITKQVNATERNGSVYITIDVVDWLKGTFSSGIPNDVGLGMLNTPLSVKIDLTNTSLAGKSIKPNYGKARNLGSDQYIIEVPFTGKDGFSDIVISEGEYGIYIESLPTATYTVIGTLLTITSNILTKAVLFSVASGGYDFDSLPVSRSNEYSITHVFNIESGKDYRIGLVSEFNQLNLMPI